MVSIATVVGTSPSHGLTSISASPASPGSSILDFRRNPFILFNTKDFESRAVKMRWITVYYLSGSSEKAQYVFEMTFGQGLQKAVEFAIQIGEAPGFSYDEPSNIVTIQLPHNSVFDKQIVEEIHDDYLRDDQLATDIYDACSKDSAIREALSLKPLGELESHGLDRSNPFIGEVIPRIVEVRKEALKLFASNPGLAVTVSSKEECMKFGRYGKMSLRVLPDGSTYVILPHIKPCFGGIKKVKYGVLISPNGKKVSLQIICKVKNTIRVASSNLLNDSFERALKLPEHPNVLLPTAMTFRDKKGYEMIMPKSDIELFDYLAPWFYGYRAMKSGLFKRSLLREKSIPHVKTGMQFLLEITNGMKHLFDHKYLHRDLKTENVMVKSFPDGSMMAQIIDLDFISPVDKIVNLAGTPGYLPLGSSHNTLATDLYALGRVIRYKERMGFDPSPAPSFNDLFGALLRMEIYRSNDGLSISIKNLKDALVCLSNDLMEGKISTYDEVLTRLNKIDEEFTPGIGGAASTM